MLSTGREIFAFSMFYTGSLKVTSAICDLIPRLAPYTPIGNVVLSSLTTILSLFPSGKKQEVLNPYEE